MAKAHKKKRYLETPVVAELLGISVKAARSWLIREGAARKIGRHWRTTSDQLLAVFPELAQALARLERP
jgi:hypothetical protein